MILDNLLRARREISRRIFTSSEISAADFVDALNESRGRARAKGYFARLTNRAISGSKSLCAINFFLKGLAQI